MGFFDNINARINERIILPNIFKYPAFNKDPIFTIIENLPEIFNSTDPLIMRVRDLLSDMCSDETICWPKSVNVDDIVWIPKYKDPCRDSIMVYPLSEDPRCDDMVVGIKYPDIEFLLCRVQDCFTDGSCSKMSIIHYNDETRGLTDVSPCVKCALGCINAPLPAKNILSKYGSGCCSVSGMPCYSYKFNDMVLFTPLGGNIKFYNYREGVTMPEQMHMVRCVSKVALSIMHMDKELEAINSLLQY